MRMANYVQFLQTSRLRIQKTTFPTSSCIRFNSTPLLRFSSIQKMQRRLPWHPTHGCAGQRTELMPKKCWVQETWTNVTSGRCTSGWPQFLSLQKRGDNMYLLASSLIHKRVFSRYYLNMDVRVPIPHMWEVCWSGDMKSRESPTSITKEAQ